MIKSIFVPVQGLPRDSKSLSAALAVARLFDAHLDCLHVRPDPRLLVASTTAGMETSLGTGVFPPELLNILSEADAKRAKTARETFDAFCAKNGISAGAAKGVDASFHELEGEVAHVVTANARYGDLAVLASDSILSDISFDATSDIIVACGRPILLVPTKSDLGALTTVAIAWKESASAARAVTAAMPILEKARSVVVLVAREGQAKVEDALRAGARRITVPERRRPPGAAKLTIEGARHRVADARLQANRLLDPRDRHAAASTASRPERFF